MTTEIVEYRLPEITSATTELQKIHDFQKLIKSSLKEGTDFGTIPGTRGNPTLLQPGAEKIVMLAGLAPKYEILSMTEDNQTGYVSYTIECTLFDRRNRELIVSQGLGSCNNSEKRFGMIAYKLETANNCLKMAKKRALVDAAKLVGSLSELFTQDLEDMYDSPIETTTKPVEGPSTVAVKGWEKIKDKLDSPEEIKLPARMLRQIAKELLPNEADQIEDMTGEEVILVMKEMKEEIEAIL